MESVGAKLHQQNQNLQDLQNQNLQDGELDKELEQRDNQIKELNGIIAKLKEQNQKLQDQLTEAQQLLSSGATLVPSQMFKQVQMAIREWVQTVGWRKWKFVMNPDLRDFTDTCHNDIAGDLGMNNNEDEDFQEHYMSEAEFNCTYGP